MVAITAKESNSLKNQEKPDNMKGGKK